MDGFCNILIQRQTTGYDINANSLQTASTSQMNSIDLQYKQNT
jgi:hypothetical protein